MSRFTEGISRMAKSGKQYKGTKNMTFKDVAKPYARIFEFIHAVSDSAEEKTRTTTEFFNEIVMEACIERFGEEAAYARLNSYIDTEERSKKASLDLG